MHARVEKQVHYCEERRRVEYKTLSSANFPCKLNIKDLLIYCVQWNEKKHTFLMLQGNPPYPPYPKQLINIVVLLSVKLLGLLH